ncbi:hypothetical protein AB0H98_09090 [Nocardia salmonicida]|uniref:hypothetical protein n=1 Tax=Nocardia salmonicida TaxID=53431 RepID=UPI0033F5B61A
MRTLVDWTEQQCRKMRHEHNARELGDALIAAYLRISLLTNTFRETELMATDGPPSTLDQILPTRMVGRTDNEYRTTAIPLLHQSRPTGN